MEKIIHCNRVQFQVSNKIGFEIFGYSYEFLHILPMFQKFWPIFSTNTFLTHPTHTLSISLSLSCGSRASYRMVATVPPVARLPGTVSGTRRITATRRTSWHRWRHGVARTAQLSRASGVRRRGGWRWRSHGDAGGEAGVTAKLFRWRRLWHLRCQYI